MAKTKKKLSKTTSKSKSSGHKSKSLLAKTSKIKANPTSKGKGKMQAKAIDWLAKSMDFGKKLSKKFKKAKKDFEKILKQYLWSFALFYVFAVSVIGYSMADGALIKSERARFYNIITGLERELNNLIAKEGEYLSNLQDVKNVKAELENYKENLEKLNLELRENIKNLKAENTQLHNKNKVLSSLLTKKDA